MLRGIHGKGLAHARSHHGGGCPPHRSQHRNSRGGGGVNGELDTYSVTLVAVPTLDGAELESVYTISGLNERGEATIGRGINRGYAFLDAHRTNGACVSNCIEQGGSFFTVNGQRRDAQSVRASELTWRFTLETSRCAEGRQGVSAARLSSVVANGKPGEWRARTVIDGQPRAFGLRGNLTPARLWTLYHANIPYGLVRCT